MAVHSAKPCAGVAATLGTTPVGRSVCFVCTSHRQLSGQHRGIDTRHNSYNYAQALHSTDFALFRTTYRIRCTVFAFSAATLHPPVVRAPYIDYQAAQTRDHNIMGGYISKFSGLIWAKKETRILILGLVRAVKTAKVCSGGNADDKCRTTQARRHYCTG